MSSVSEYAHESVIAGIDSDCVPKAIPCTLVSIELLCLRCLQGRLQRVISSVPPVPPTLSSPSKMSLTAEQQALKERFEASVGSAAFDESWARILKFSPDMFAASMRLVEVPKKKGHLSPKVQSLVSIAISASSTHLYVPSIHRHTKAALANGATKAEIVEVLSLTSTLGIHACTVGVPILFEVLEEQGKPMPKGMEDMSKDQLAMKEDFEKKRGYWNTLWEEFLRLSPEFFYAYTEFSSVPWVNEGGKGVLEPKVCYVVDSNMLEVLISLR
jgi:alkylhydroperoxidase/carboxymuconolactone decarboxylase family protein YurZ